MLSKAKVFGYMNGLTFISGIHQTRYLTPVILCEAPGRVGASRNWWARSRRIPTMFPLPCRC